MDSLLELTYGPVELAGWGFQVLLIVLVSRRAAGPIRLPEPSLSFCLLVLCLGWVLRLAYLFALASDGFTYWIGDDPSRWLTAWSWVNWPDVKLVGEGTWMPGATLIHGIAMALIPNPLFASKLLSASYSVMSLAGVFVFAQALFRNRAISLACVVFLAPFWLDILLSSGTMTEMPTVGAMLCGAGALLFGLRLPVGRRRTLFLFSAAASFAIATLFHMVAWIQLTGILLFLLPVFLRSTHGTPLTRFRSWVLFCAVSTSWCLVWAIEQWASTGSPFTAFHEAGAQARYKIGGPLDLVEALGPVASAGEMIIVAFAALVLLVVIVSCTVVPGNLRRARWGVALVGVACAFVALGVSRGWLNALSPDTRELVVANLAVFPLSLVYCLYYYLPLALYGIFAVLRKQQVDYPEQRWVLACIGWVFAILIATSALGGANETPFRTVLPLSATLLPFALAPLFARVSLEPTLRDASYVDWAKSIPRRAWPTLGVALLVLGANAVANHIRIDSELPAPCVLRRGGPLLTVQGIEQPTAADIAALGAWLRAETRAASHLSAQNLSHPFEVSLLFEFSGLNQMLLEYHMGDPARFAHPLRRTTPERRTLLQLVRELVPGQVLISDSEVGNPRLRLISRVGQYWVYERSRP